MRNAATKRSNTMPCDLKYAQQVEQPAGSAIPTVLPLQQDLGRGKEGPEHESTLLKQALVHCEIDEIAAAPGPAIGDIEMEKDPVPQRDV